MRLYRPLYDRSPGLAHTWRRRLTKYAANAFSDENLFLNEMNNFCARSVVMFRRREGNGMDKRTQQIIIRTGFGGSCSPRHKALASVSAVRADSDGCSFIESTATTQACCPDRKRSRHRWNTIAICTALNGDEHIREARSGNYSGTLTRANCVPRSRAMEKLQNHENSC